MDSLFIAPGYHLSSFVHKQHQECLILIWVVALDIYQLKVLVNSPQVLIVENEIGRRSEVLCKCLKYLLLHLFVLHKYIVAGDLFQEPQSSQPQNERALRRAFVYQQVHTLLDVIVFY